MSMRAKPLLRTPPFPWADAWRAAISTAAPSGLTADDTRLETLTAGIREARIGGAFWAPPLPAMGVGTIVLRPNSADEIPLRIAQARALPPGPILAVLPNPAWGSDALEAAGAHVFAGTFDPWSILAPGVRLLASADDEWVLIAALAGAEVIGLSSPALVTLLGKALIENTIYRDPFAGRMATAEQTIPILADWRRTCDANRAVSAAAGMAWWKRTRMAQFLWTGRPAPLTFLEDKPRPRPSSQDGIAAWPSRMPPDLAEEARAADIPLIRVEDGFIRSIGLGANLHPPLSIVVDRTGIYYDPTGPSDLETILETADFSADLIERAGRLTERIVLGGISKYESAPPPAADAAPRPRRTVLVAGQVEDDMSVRLGGAGVAGNLDLLRRARAAEPDAHILFKPHPDVDAGHRRGNVPDVTLRIYADEIVRDEGMPALLARVDAVHVLTSLTGFEALLRGLEVTTHGHPFFAGWGLTRDLAGPVPRRSRRLTRDQLVAGTLILYPRYLDPVTELPCPPEILLDRFANGWRPKTTWLIRARRLQGKLARMIGKTSF